MEAPPRFEVTAPEGAPNVVIVLIDDIMVTGGSTLHAVGKKVEGA
jgi:predicted amidophosphoribosyltransferase